MLVGCLVGAAVFAALPTDKSPTLRQAIVAADVPASGAPATNLDRAITGWSWECDADNYGVGYFVENADPSQFGRVWIDRYDADKKKWTEISFEPPLGRTAQAERNEVVTLFWDGFDLYVELKGASGDVRTLQFARDLSYRRQFFGKTVAGLAGGALLYDVDADDPAHNDSLYSVFDPDSGASQSVFPAEPAPPIEIAGERLAMAQYAKCGAAWFKKHAMPVNAKHPIEGLILARANTQTDALAFGVSYGGFQCDNEMMPEPELDAIYVYRHPDDPKRVRFVEVPVADAKQVTPAKLDELLTKPSLTLLFASPSPSPSRAPSANPIASSSPAPSAPAPILGGITLGEDAGGVLRRFGLHAQGWSSGGAPPSASSAIEFRLFKSQLANVVVGLLFDAKIKLITVKGPSDPHSDFADPSGIRLGDSIDRLTQVRGTPDGTEPDGEFRYGPKDGIHWLFGITDQKITTIAVTDGP